MVFAPKQPQAISAQEYLRREKESAYKSEYFAGEVFMMAGGSPNRNRISLNVSSRFSIGLTGKGCEAFNSDQRLFITKNGLFTYPDAIVVCGQIQFDKTDRDAITNPRLIVEVLSPSTKDYDQGGKFELYRDIETFREYLLIHQDKVHVEHYYKDDEGRWILTEIKELEAMLILETVNFELPIRQIYERVDWLID